MTRSYRRVVIDDFLYKYEEESKEDFFPDSKSCIDFFIRAVEGELTTVLDAIDVQNAVLNEFEGRNRSKYDLLFLIEGGGVVVLEGLANKLCNRGAHVVNLPISVRDLKQSFRGGYDPSIVRYGIGPIIEKHSKLIKNSATNRIAIIDSDVGTYGISASRLNITAELIHDINENAEIDIIIGVGNDRYLKEGCENQAPQIEWPYILGVHSDQKFIKLSDMVDKRIKQGCKSTDFADSVPNQKAVEIVFKIWEKAEIQELFRPDKHW